jgi:hypothetical protein
MWASRYVKLGREAGMFREFLSFVFGLFTPCAFFCFRFIVKLRLRLGYEVFSS